MEAVGSAASIIAVIELAAKVASLCVQYSSAVKNAKSDIERLQREVGSLETTLQHARLLLQGPNGERLRASRALWDGLRDCSSQLTQLQSTLEKKLHSGSARTNMRRFGLRALKWPFESKEIDSIIKNLEKYRDTLVLGLTVDQTNEVLNVGQTLVLSKLPVANDAAFDSHADEHDARCHPDTRVDLLKDIREWAEDPQGKCVFWLNGMAGTGKSTISRTLAQSFADRGLLGASFFFKRGERDRGNAALLFPTIAAQLAAKDTALAVHVKAALEADPAVVHKALKEQFEKLILQPLNSFGGVAGSVKTFVLVVDALDECERDNDIRLIIYLLSQAKTLNSVRLRAFLTSRPELPIRLGFSDVRGKYQDLVLHDIPKPIIEHDIAAFLGSELAKIRSDYNALSPSLRLPPSWPGTQVVQTLVDMATPLFIFATTVCRFIRDPVWCDPDGQLAKVLEYQPGTQLSEIDKLDATYRPVLDRLLVGSEASKKSLLDEFRTVVGTIVLLAEPLSVHHLARLLNVPDKVIIRRLEPLHSVLSVPDSPISPVRTFHLSFHDFLVDPDKKDSNPFWIDRGVTNNDIATRCLELLTIHLKKDICELKLPGMARNEVESSVIHSNLPPHIRYACIYWIHHIQQAGTRITDNHQVHTFLINHFLHWLETLSLLGKISESVGMIRTLQGLMSPGNSTLVAAFLYDALRFVLSFRHIIDLHPLQIYSSAIIFAPMKSIIRGLSYDHINLWIPRPPKVNQEWSACQQTLEGHSEPVNHVAFSPDGTMLASASGDNTVRLWDVATGACHQTLEGHSNWVNHIAFSPDGTMLASASYDKTVRLWDVATGTCQQMLEGHSGSVSHIAFSPDGTMLASASDDETVRLWDVATGTCQQTLEGHSRSVNHVAFSPDGIVLASASYDKTIRLWDVATSTCQQMLEGHSGSVSHVAFSPDGTMLASASGDETVRLWDVATGTCQQTLEGHSRSVNHVAFSPDGIVLASASYDKTIRLWDVATGACQQTLETPTIITRLSFSDNGDYLKTNLGSIEIASDRHIIGISSDPQPLKYILSVNSNWISRNGKNLVWLPPDYRATSVAVHNHTLTLGHPSGQVSFIQFAPEY